MFGKKRAYLDMAAGFLGNPSSPYEEGRRARRKLEDARAAIARLVEAQADDLIFTSGATESNALALLGHVRARRAQAGSDTPGRNHLHMLYLPTAHASIVENARLLAEEGVQVEPLPLSGARVDTVALKNMLRKETVLVSMDAVCGETGIVWNTREVADVLRHFDMRGTDRPLLHVDASQAPLTEKVTRDHFGADLLVFDAAKVGAIRSVSALIAHRTIPLAPLYRGGHQERTLRPGTESPERVAHFAKTFAVAVRCRERFHAKAHRARGQMVQYITKKLPDVLVQEGKTQAPHILNIALPGRDTDYLVTLLDAAGFAIATRSACETDSETGSRAVLALTGDADRARSTIRISWGPAISTRTLMRFARALVRETMFIDSTT